MHRPGFLEPAKAVFLLQPFHRRFFDDGLTVRDAVQLGMDGVAFHREGVVFPNKFLKGELPHLVEEFRKGTGLKFPQAEEHPFRCP